MMRPARSNRIGPAIDMQSGRHPRIQEFALRQRDALHCMKVVPTRPFDEETVVRGRRQDRTAISGGLNDRLPPDLSQLPPSFQRPVALNRGEQERRINRDLEVVAEVSARAVFRQALLANMP
jgi:hypothetical protein